MKSIADTMMKRGITRKQILLFLSMAVALLCEIFIFNRAHFMPMGKLVTNPDAFFDDGSKLVYGKEYSFSEGFSITVPDIYKDVRNYHLEIPNYRKDKWSTYDAKRMTALHVKTSITDEGHALFYSFNQLLICPSVASSMYIPVEAYGEVKDLKIFFQEDIDHITIESLCLNARPPLRVNIIRIIVVCLVLFSISSIFSLPFTIDENEKKEARRRTIALMIAFMVLCFLATAIQREDRIHGAAVGYPELARSFAHGEVSVGANTNEVLRDMDNPYDWGLRDELGAQYYWDTAYYMDSYFVYFGATPAIIFQLPYYLLTGNDLNYIRAQIIMNFFILLGALLLVDEIRKKYYKSCPISLEVLIYITFSLAVGIGILVKRPAVYYEAIGTALMLVLWGLFLWIHSVREEKVCLWQGMLGSFLMAASVGARPQFAIASFAAFYVYRKQFSAKKIKDLVLLILPYIPVAIALMAYNEARFDSVFDFGANYNLTTHDMTHIGIHISRIPMGIWYYLIRLPIFDYTFPFMRFDHVGGVYQGFIAYECQAGGVLALTPFLFLGAYLLREKSAEGRLVRGALASTLIIVIADALMCGVSMRYQLDFRVVMAFPVVIAVMNWMHVLHENNDKIRLEKYYRVTAALCYLTIALGVLTFLCQYEVCDYIDMETNPVFYCYLRDLFGG